MIDYGYCQSEMCWGAASPVPMSEPSMRAILQGIKDVGGSRVRVAVQVGTWDDLDRTVNLSVEYGIKPLLCIMANTTLGYTGTVASYAALCKTIALRYGPSGSNKVAEYEIFNESNNIFFNEPKLAPAGFATYQKAGYEAIHSVHSSAVVLPGGTVPTYDVAFGWAMNPVDWYKGLYAAGCKNYMDAIAFHLYCEEPPSPTVRQWKYMLDIRDLMVAQGDGAKKIWVTEVGTSYPGPGVTSTVVERDWLKTMVEGIESYSYTAPFFVYNYRNSRNNPNDATGDNYGIENFDGTRKTLKYEYAKTIAGTPSDPGDITPPTEPTNFKVVDAGTRSATATWSPATDDVGVSVYRIYNAANNAKMAETVQIGQSATLVGNLTPGTPYSLYATAVDAAGNESVPSNTFPFTTLASSGLLKTFTYAFTGSTVPMVFSQLGLGFTVAAGLARANPPTTDGTYRTIAPYTSDQASPDHFSEIAFDARAAKLGTAALTCVRSNADGTQRVEAYLSAGERADACRIVTYDNGVTRVRKATNATPLALRERLRLTAEGATYTVSRVASGVVTEILTWTDLAGVYAGADNMHTAIGWLHQRVSSVNYTPPGITDWESSDLNAVQTASGGVEPWMYAIVDMDDWAELTATGSWETLISNRKLEPAPPGVSVPPTPSTFVTRDSSTGNLMFGGQRYRFGGANAPFMGIIGSAPAAVAGETVLPGDGYHYASHAQIDATLAAAQAFNSNVLTSWGAVQSVGTSSSVQPTLGVFNVAALEPTDYCLQQCNLLGIKLIINFSGNYTYETEGSKYWYCTANGVTPDAYATQFFTNTTIINSLKAHITFCLDHVNQYTGIAYKDDPAILAWGTGGEMSTYPAYPEWPYYAWTDAISTHIKVTCGAQQLVADGHCAIRSDMQDGVIDVNSLTLPNVDMYQLHPYSHWTPPRYSTQEGKICHSYGKAYFIGEFPWQGTEPDMSTPTIWSPTELMSVAKGSTYVDGIQMWELLAPNVTFGGGYTLHWPTPDNSSGHGIPLETARGREMAANNLAMASGKVWPTRLVAVRTAGVQYNSAAYRGGGFNAEGITLYIPEENDVVLAFGGSQGVNTVANAPAGWVNPLGANVGVSSASHTLACMYHVVTAAEALAANVSYVIANMFGSTANGDGAITVIRGANPASVIDAFATASGTATTTHVLPGLTGASLQDDSMVISCVSSFANNAYTVPAGTGEAGWSNGHQGIWMGLYDDFTTAGVNVAAKNITAVNSDVYASITLAITGL